MKKGSLIGAAQRRAGPPAEVILFDSFDSGSSGWQFDSAGDTTEYYAGQRTMIISPGITITKIKMKLNGGFWTSYSKFSIKVCANLSGDTIDPASPLGESDEVDGDAAWSNTMVVFPFITPLVISARTIGLALGASSRKAGYAASGTNTQAMFTTAIPLTGQMVSFGSDGAVKYHDTFGAYDLQMQIWGY